jgi:hypothetical protein
VDDGDVRPRPRQSDRGASRFRRTEGEDLDCAAGHAVRGEPVRWREAAGTYGEVGSYPSVADVIDAGSLQKVRALTKQQTAATAQT